MMRPSCRVSQTAPFASYNPYEHFGAVSLPNVHASTYAFEDSEDGEHAFGCAYGIADTVQRLDPQGTRKMHLIYARLTTPTILACEKSMKALEPDADWAYLFPSGMGAITTLVQSVCHQAMDPNGTREEGRVVRDYVIHNVPIYGGTHALMHSLLRRWGFKNIELNLNDPNAVLPFLKKYGSRIAMILLETPANPTTDMVDIKAVRSLVDEVYGLNQYRPLLAVDNTFMGIFSHPLPLGADVVVYSATKYLGGHADLISGFLVGKNGPKTLVKPFMGSETFVDLSTAILGNRTICGYTPASDVAQRLWTHMQTYPMRMRRSAEVATQVAQFLAGHPKVTKVQHPSLLQGAAKELYERQCTGPSSMIAFTLAEDTKGAVFRLLNNMKLIVRAVSLGANRTLANHPATWTHSDITPEAQREMGITPGLIRLSVGIEEPEDLIADLEQALRFV